MEIFTTLRTILGGPAPPFLNAVNSPTAMIIIKRAQTYLLSYGKFTKGVVMKYIVQTSKSVEQAVSDLQTSAAHHAFGVLHIHNLQETLKKKGVDFPNACQILEICNPQSAKDVLTENMELNMALPCRVSVYSENGKTKIGMIRPTAMLKALSDSPKLARIANEVENGIIAMIEEAK